MFMKTPAMYRLGMVLALEGMGLECLTTVLDHLFIDTLEISSNTLFIMISIDP